MLVCLCVCVFMCKCMCVHVCMCVFVCVLLYPRIASHLLPRFVPFRTVPCHGFSSQVLAGCYCLLRYVENCTGQGIAAHSLRIEYVSSQCSAGRMTIDRKTALSLELVSNARDGNQKESLFGTIDFTTTVVGARLLRASLLRPYTGQYCTLMGADSTCVWVASWNAFICMLLTLCCYVSNKEAYAFR